MSSNGTAARANRPARRLAAPARAFCSMTIIGTRHRIAPIVQGNAAYPPSTTTTCGRNRRTSPMPDSTPRATPEAAAMLDDTFRGMPGRAGW